MANANYVPLLTIGDSVTSGTGSPIIYMTGGSTGTPEKKDVDGINIMFRGGGGPADSSEINAVFFGGK